MTRNTPTLLQARRAELHLTLAEIAARVTEGSGTRCSEGSVSEWERLLKEPRGSARAAYATALQLPLEQLAAIYWRQSAEVAGSREVPRAG